eukprot:8088464-Heterocapsa_arctica.AAC.1
MGPALFGPAGEDPLPRDLPFPPPAPFGRAGFPRPRPAAVPGPKTAQVQMKFFMVSCVYNKQLVSKGQLRSRDEGTRV